MIPFLKDSNLIMDLGMNNGDDTAYYLARGHSVVAVEADPALCVQSQERFASALSTNQLTIINAAVSEKDEQIPFFINTVNSHWSSLDAKWASREGHPLREISIQGISIPRLFASYGTPLYLKVDLEGAEEMVLDQLRNVPLLPRFISVEDCRFGLRYMEIMASLGYSCFQIVDQSLVPETKDAIVDWQFSPGSSGVFGSSLPGCWMGIDEMREYYGRVVRSANGVRLAPSSRWFDIHARGPDDASI